MGLTNNNPLLTGVRGRIGNLVIKQYKYGTVITLMPSYTERPPTPRQRTHRAMFAEAVKYGKAQKQKHLMQYGKQGAAESHEIYKRSIQEFMAAVKRIRQNDVHFESSWAGLSEKNVIAEMIKLAASIVSGEYDKKWAAVAAKPPAMKKPVPKKAVVKKDAKKPTKKK